MMRITQHHWVTAGCTGLCMSSIFYLVWIWSLVLVWMLSNISSLLCSSLITVLKKYCNHSTGSDKSPSQHSLIIIHSTERNSYSYQREECTPSITLSQVTPALCASISNRDYKSEANRIWISTFVSFQESFIKFQSKSISSNRNNLKDPAPFIYDQLSLLVVALKKTMTA